MGRHKKEAPQGMSYAKIGESRLVKDCLICDSSIILMARKDNTILPDNNSYVNLICESCKEKYLNEGVMIVNPKTGSFIVLRNQVFQDLFNQEIPKCKISYCDEIIINKIMEMQRLTKNESDSNI